MDIKELTYAINGAVFEVNKVLGPGFLEKVYENALLTEMEKRGLKAESQVPLKVYYKEEMVGEYFADILVEGRIVIEIKTVESIGKSHEAQLLNSLKATGLKVGLLVNFKHDPARSRGWYLTCPKGRMANDRPCRPVIVCVCLR
ncbi:MAG: GxxExxY protein, partial [Deltaproteobacteria bacterium]|nr:GxxExxY protein [Deltaproteobacteria bacterium]